MGAASSAIFFAGFSLQQAKSVSSYSGGRYARDFDGSHTSILCFRRVIRREMAVFSMGGRCFYPASLFYRRVSQLPAGAFLLAGCGGNRRNDVHSEASPLFRYLYSGENGWKDTYAGLIHPVILLPDGYSKTEQYHILVHELCHYKYKDMIFLWISLVIAAFQWFNPVIWLSCFLFRRDLETLCDERALRVIEDRKAYCMLLLKTALRKNNFVAGTTGLQNGKKEVDVRIRRIAAWKRTSKGWMIFSVVLLITLGAVCLTNGQSQDFPMTPTAFQILPGELENSLKKAGYRLVNEETVRSWHYRLNGNVHYQDSETGVSYDAEKLAAKYGYDLKNYYGQTIAAYLYDVANEKEPLSSAKEIFLSAVAENGEVFTLKLASDSQKEYVAGKIDAFLAR